MGDSELPFRAEYAKSNRSSCKACKEKIDKDVLRMAIMVQSPMFDGKVPNWYHFSCFFLRTRIASTQDIAHYNQLRWEDQQKIKQKIAGSPVAASSGKSKKGKKSSDGDADAKNGTNRANDFKTEYAKSNRSVCCGCSENITKNDIRVSIKDYESESAQKYGPVDRWHHVDCFVKRREELMFFMSAEKIPGFKLLSQEDRDMLKSKLPAIKSEGKRSGEDGGATPAKKRKTEEPSGFVDDEKLKLQNKQMYKHRDDLKKYLNKTELADLLSHNGQSLPEGESRMLDRLSDMMTFGALQPCPECKNGQFVYANDKEGYLCHGNLTDWTKCSNKTKKPKRKKASIPGEMKAEYSFLKKYKPEVSERLFEKVTERPNIDWAKPSSSTATAVKKEFKEDAARPLSNLKFVVSGKFSTSSTELKNKIKALGGKVGLSVDESIAALISTQSDVDKLSKKVVEAQRADVHVVPEDFVDSAGSGNIAQLIKAKAISSWGSEPTQRFLKSGMSKGKSVSLLSGGPSKMKLTVKGGAAVWPESDLADVAHVLKDSGDLYTVVLGMVDIQRKTNSYYKLQLLESDDNRRYWVFRAWGRVGTTIGGTKVEKMSSKDSAITEFCRLYEEKTGNEWWDRKDFRKVPNRFYPIDMDFGEDDAQVKDLKSVMSQSKSLLPKPVKELITLLFDVENMKKTLLEFEIDLEKMPLGKLSKKQIQSAYKVLSELQALISSGGSESRFLDASNRFFTLVPHDFGLRAPPVLKTEELIKSKIDLLDNMMEIEVAYSMMKVEEDSAVDPIDSHYKKLSTDVEVLERDGEEFRIIDEYLRNTHAATHQQFKLVIEQIFKVKRHGEATRYKPFRKLHNRQLLWHGSRLSNFAGILSHGLKIAPPEAPVTGYMFGKGIYFADMVSKSANYCYTNKSSPTGLLLLSEVALGNMHELIHAESIEKLPAGKHSAKGLGRTGPDPSCKKLLGGVEVPLGKPVDNSGRFDLLYNEYIVYDVSQVNIKYLLKLNFQYNY